MSKMGRPSKYDPKYCDSVIEFMRSGVHSLHSWAASNGISKRTVTNWASENEEFADAINIAKGLRTMAIEAEAWNETSGGRQGYFARMLCNNSPEEYNEKRQVELSGSIETVTKEQRDAAVAAATRADS